MGNSGRIALALSALLSLSLGVPVAAQSVAAAPPITITDLGSLGGTTGYNYVNGMNESGMVVGGATTAGGYHAYSWTAAGGFKDLGTLTDPVTHQPWPESFAYAVNDAGQVAGTSAPGSGGPAHAVIWSAAGAITDLGLGPNGYMAWAKLINSKGWVAGEFESNTAPAGRHAFFWSPSTGMRDLGSLGGNFLTVTGMNADGVVVGVAANATGYSRAFASKAKVGPLKDLGTLGGNNSSASGINDAGKITGNSDAPTGNHAFVYSNNKMTDIHTIGSGSYAAAINANGMVVGQVDSDAFVYTPTGGMVDIGRLPGGGSSRATAVSKNGKVTGVSGAADNKDHAFIWTAAGGMVNATANALERSSIGAFINAAGQISGTYIDMNNETYGYQKGFFIDPVQGRKNIQDHGYTNSTAVDVNASGLVVGTSLNPDGFVRGFVWNNGTLTMIPMATPDTASDAIAVNDLGQVIGHYNLPGYSSYGYVWGGSGAIVPINAGPYGTTVAAINCSGAIIGYAADGTPTGTAFLRKPDGTMVPIVPIQYGYGVQPRAINDSGVVIGTFLLNGGYRTFQWTEAGGFTDLGVDGPAAINNNGDTTGTFTLNDGRQHAYLQKVHGARKDLGEFPGTGSSSGLYINASAQVVGLSGTGFFYDTKMRDLGSLGSGGTIPLGMNDGGQVIGWAYTLTSPHGFVWSKSLGIRDLGTLGGAESKALQINNSGQAVGQASLVDGSVHAVLWKTQ